MTPRLGLQPTWAVINICTRLVSRWWGRPNSTFWCIMTCSAQWSAHCYWDWHSLAPPCRSLLLNSTGLRPSCYYSYDNLHLLSVNSINQSDFIIQQNSNITEAYNIISGPTSNRIKMKALIRSTVMYCVKFNPWHFSVSVCLCSDISFSHYLASVWLSATAYILLHSTNIPQWEPLECNCIKIILHKKKIPHIPRSIVRELIPSRSLSLHARLATLNPFKRINDNKWLLLIIWIVNTNLLGEQLLTDVNACLKITLRLAKASMFGVLHTVLLYTPSSKPASSATQCVTHAHINTSVHPNPFTMHDKTAWSQLWDYSLRVHMTKLPHGIVMHCSIHYKEFHHVCIKQYNVCLLTFSSLNLHWNWCANHVSFSVVLFEQL